VIVYLGGKEHVTAGGVVPDLVTTTLGRADWLVCFLQPGKVPVVLAQDFEL
jgi:hypothetical protein